MPHYNLAFLGFGNVGKALAELLLRKAADIVAQRGVTFSVTGIATGSRGIAIDPNGIDLAKALELVKSGQSINELNLQPSTFNSQTFIENCGADVLFETIPVNYESGQPAIDYIRAALELGMHVTTANKGPVVHGYHELTALAKSKGRKFYFESAVMDGAPVFGLFRETLPAANLNALRGVLNSTTNLLLTRMEAGESFEDAVAYAQSIGIAETDPSGDVDGWDAAIKVCALVSVMMGVPLKPHDVDRTGIGGISVDDVAQAKSEGKRWKLVCEALRDGDQVRARVAPQKVGVESPLYGVMGTTSIVEFESDVLGKLSLIEADPGPHTTAYGLLADFLNAVA
ncbi:MAG: homoserine dehydrogenase [Chloroflexi bacterium]|jgi:homoserine dehydrogenase|nr:homoserine dehydrogenase [Chloroflexota bacterium]